MNNKKNVTQFILLSFAISWFAALFMYLADIDYGSVTSLVIVAVFYMPAPAFATMILHKYILKKPFTMYNFGLKGASKKWLFLYTPLLFTAFAFCYFLVIYVLGNQLQLNGFGNLDLGQGYLLEKLTALSKGVFDPKKYPFPITASAVLSLGLFSVAVAAFTLNLPFMLGEELGWRGFLWNEVKQMGFVKANIFIGFFWGLWHAPIIMMGHNYPDQPYWGVLMMIVFCISMSFSFSYLREKSNTIWAACVWHGLFNGSAALLLLFVDSSESMLGGIAGLGGIFALLLLTICIFLLDKKAFFSKKTK